MTCHPQDIYLYLEGELSTSGVAEVEAHLAQCENCAELAKSQQFILNELDGLGTLSLPDGFDRSIIERTHDDLRWTFQQRSECRRATLAATALAMATLGLLSFQAVTSTVSQIFLGLRVGGRMLWDITTILFQGLSFASGVSLGTSLDIMIMPVLLALIMMMLTLVFRRLMGYPAADVNGR